MPSHSEEKYMIGLIKLTAGLVLGLGLIVTGNIFLVSIPSESAKSDDHINRNPAGFLTPPSTGQTVDELQDKMQTLALPCQINKGEPVKTVKAKLLRVTGGNCDAFTNLSVINHTNGISAIVFQTSSKAFTTDYFSLDKGSNKIWISQDTANGEHLLREMIVVSE